MASPHIHLHLFFFFIIIYATSSSSSQIPKALLLPVWKHPSSHRHHYLTRISQRTPLVPITLSIDLSHPFLSVHSFSSSSSSSSYGLTPCHSTLCALAHSSRSRRPLCAQSNNRPCTLPAGAGYLSHDVLSLPSTDGLNPLSPVSVPNFIFLSGPHHHQRPLAGESQGIAGLGHGPFALPTQLATDFGFPPKFSICIAPSANADGGGNGNGVIFLGDGPYVFLPGIDVSKLLIYTPLILKTGPRSNGYYFSVKSIRINGKKLPMNESLLSIDGRGNGGTRISTAHPYSVIESSIYESLTRMFIEEAAAVNVSRVAAVAPFEVCFGNRGGSSFPVIDLMLQDEEEEVFWRIFETNSMVVVPVEGRGEMACLGLFNGGVNPVEEEEEEASIVIGGYQLEDNLLQFEMDDLRMGFTNSLLLRQTSCANFNFTGGE